MVETKLSTPRLHLNRLPCLALTNPIGEGSTKTPIPFQHRNRIRVTVTDLLIDNELIEVDMDR